ncbi:MAG: serine/threonine protein kinase, partial [Cyanobacteria bacterium J06643_5]
IPGKSLKQLIENKQRFTEGELHQIASEVLEILCYLHTLNPQVIHRDIKPSNLILGGEGVYLIDFGAVQDNAVSKGATFTVVGTYGYAPIEQFGGRTVPASDLYALGATLIHLATGIIPADLPQTKTGIQFQDKVSLSNGFIDWIKKLTEIYVEDRFANSSEALKALKYFSDNNDLDCHFADNSCSDIAKPISTKIKLNKSNNRLEIEIPARRIMSADVFTTFFISLFLFIATFNILIALPISLIVVCILSIIRSYTYFYLIFNREYFLIKWTIFGIPSYKKQGSISEINYFSIDNNIVDWRKSVILKTETKKYKTNVHLTDSEREWLTKEMKNWLDV